MPLQKTFAYELIKILRDKRTVVMCTHGQLKLRNPGQYLYILTIKKFISITPTNKNVEGTLTPKRII